MTGCDWYDRGCQWSLGVTEGVSDDWECELFQDDHMRFLQEQLQQPDYLEAMCNLPSPLYPSQNLGKIMSVQHAFLLLNERSKQ